MKIHYKGLVKDRFGDAPFIGTLFLSPDCKNNCRGCFNQHLKDLPTLYEEGIDIINKIKEDPFCEGIIFAGLDPLTYPDELCHMIDLALDNNLEIIIYTALPDYNSLVRVAPRLSEYRDKGILVKYGAYDETKKVSNYITHGVPLATSNQYIEYL